MDLKFLVYNFGKFNILKYNPALLKLIFFYCLFQILSNHLLSVFGLHLVAPAVPAVSGIVLPPVVCEW